MRKILIVGATSAIAEACARLWTQRGDMLFLAARNAARLQTIAEDLRVRGGERVGMQALDLADLELHAALLHAAESFMGGLDTVLIAHGTLTDQPRAQSDVSYALRELQINGMSTVSLMSLVGERFAAQKRGTIAVISSVAGDRGRQSNYVYGSAKALVTTFASGQRQRLHKLGVNVMTVKPGFVDTPMTAAFRKGVLWAQPAQVAQDIVAGIEHGRAVVYTPRFWRLIMAVIKGIPELVFVRLSL